MQRGMPKASSVPGVGGAQVVIDGGGGEPDGLEAKDDRGEDAVELAEGETELRRRRLIGTSKTSGTRGMVGGGVGVAA